MATLTLRTTKGSPLTYAEIDNNFTNLDSDASQNLAGLDSDISALQNDVADAMVVGSSQPASPKEGEQWFDPSSGYVYIWYVDSSSGQWLAVGGAG